jgi:hypothetical protein
MLLIGALAVLDKVWAPGTGKLQSPAEAAKIEAAAAPPAGTTDIYWVDTGTNADWGGRDYAYASTSVPKYSLKDTNLCDANKIGYLATCWDARPTAILWGS